MAPFSMRAAAFVLLLAIAGCADTRFAEVRRVTLTESTGNCVGDPRTPLCALETFFACSVRRDLSLCAKVGVTNFGFGDYPKPPVVPTHDEYILLKEYEYTAQAGDRFLPSIYEEPPADGGFVKFDLISRTCYSNGICLPAKGWENYFAIVRPVDRVWHMASWWGSEPEGDDEPPEGLDEPHRFAVH